jgi:DnaJ-class molecular chaperone
MPKLNDTARGDMLAKISVVLPVNLNEKERSLFEQLRNLRPN